MMIVPPRPRVMQDGAARIAVVIPGKTPAGHPVTPKLADVLGTRPQFLADPPGQRVGEADHFWREIPVEIPEGHEDVAWVAAYAYVLSSFVERQAVQWQMGFHSTPMRLPVEAGKHQLEREDTLVDPRRQIGNRTGQLSRKDEVSDDRLCPCRSRFVGGGDHDVVLSWGKIIPAQRIHPPVLIEVLDGRQSVIGTGHRQDPPERMYT